MTRGTTTATGRGAGTGTTAGARADLHAIFPGDTEMAVRCRAVDWAATPLGPPTGWRPELRAAVRLVLASPAGMSLWCGPAYTLLYNDAYRRVLGAKHPAALARSGAEVWAEIWPEIAPQFEQVRLGGPPIAAEHVPFLVARRDGGGVEQGWFDYALSAVPGEDGAVLAVLSVASDTSARVQAERALAGERTRLARMLDVAPAVMAIYSGPDQVLTYVNPTWSRVVGKPDALGRPFREAFPEMAETGLFEQLKRVYETGEPYTVTEMRLPIQRQPGGPVEDSYWDFVWQPQPAVGAPGTDGGRGPDILVHAIEVTGHVRARQEVERLLGESERARADAEAARARSEAVLSSIADAFYLLDREWRFTYVNAAAEPLLQTTRARLLGRTLWEAFPGVAGSPFEGPYREAMATGRVTSAEAYFPPLGTWFDVRSYPWDGGLMVHFRDIGARKAAEAERERLLADAEAARREAEAANRAKSEFLAIMSHELRTPLNAIGGYAELMEMGIRGPVTAQQREDLRRLQASQRHLLGLINEVLNYAKLETGTVQFDVAPVRVRDALAGAEALVAPQASAKGLTLAVADGAPDVLVRADAEKLRQILVNLLSNAVKFTNAGGRIELAGATRDDTVLIHVRDTGIGIAADQLERIFDPFVQVRADLTRPHEGTGLGLAISRDLARGMGGDLTVESTPGMGSTFRLTLPAGSS